MSAIHETARDLADGLLRASGSALHLYTDYNQKRIVEVARIFLESEREQCANIADLSGREDIAKAIRDGG